MSLSARERSWLGVLGSVALRWPRTRAIPEGVLRLVQLGLVDRGPSFLTLTREGEEVLERVS